MKKIAILVLTIMMSTIAFSQDIKREGKTFSTDRSSSTTTLIETGYNWKDSKGEESPIYLTKTGKAFVLKTSKKTGNQYRYYLKDEVANTILEENPSLKEKVEKREEGKEEK